MARMTGGQALVQTLIAEGVETIFGIPGIQLDWAYDALHAERDRVRVVHPRHEQAAAYMADGYARSTGRVGTYLVVPGPGVLNTTAALSTAFACNSPVLCVTGQIQSDLIGVKRGILHEIDDQLGLLAHLTKWTGAAATPAEIPTLVRNAFGQLRNGRPRPVAIEIPPDVLQATDSLELGTAASVEPSAGDPDALEAAARALGGAVRPIIFAGGGVMASGAWEEVRRIADLLEAPVIQTVNGRGTLSDRDHRSFVQLAIPDLLPSSDAVLAVGTRMLHFANQPITIDPGVPFARIDADPAQIDRNVTATIGIVADAKAALAALADRIERHNRHRDSRRDELLSLKARLAEIVGEARPQSEYGLAIRAALPDDAIVVNEMTQVGYWTNLGMPIYEPRSYITSGYQGTLGYGFPTALGAQVGNPNKRVVSITGDGGLMFSIQELATAAQHNIPAIVVVFNDNAYGNVKRIQENTFDGRTIASDLNNPSFSWLAEVFGVRGVRVDSVAALGKAVREAVDAVGPTLIEVPVGPMPMFLRQIRERLTRELTQTRA